ncbi:ankyrin repeat domain-containing protein [Desulfopila sp. IMCC35006]|uniref:ankyrin repeat domain-containing protein n=1 Tax=Desulfopila sp. IMCC35006 TaxID=2569542 RepID=UPI00142EEEE8|nr:ankyrin repeat domain-containing protein [Desulfopila sp. IMCC35006]
MRILSIVILVITLLATAGCEKKSPFVTIDLLEAAARGDLTGVKNLLDQGADVNVKNKDGITALMLASADGYKDIVELLLTQGADVNGLNNNGETALDLTSYTEIKVLLRKYDQSATPDFLCYAARVGDIHAVETYLARGVDINARETEGLTALIEASQEGKKDVVALLLEKGADINTRTEYGLTALMAASRNGHSDVVKLLLAKRADVNIKNTYGDSALSIASKMSHRDIVELLHQHDAAAK